MHHLHNLLCVCMFYLNANADIGWQLQFICGCVKTDLLGVIRCVQECVNVSYLELEVTQEQISVGHC